MGNGDESRALSSVVIGACIEVHRQLGPGLLESAYERCVAHELTLRGVPFERQCPIAVGYKGIELECAFRADLVVDGKLLVELKAIERLTPVHDAQVHTYLKLADLRLGLLINFNVSVLKDGVRRFTRK